MKNLFLLVASIIFLIGCQKQKEPTDNLYAFKEYLITVTDDFGNEIRRRLEIQGK